MKIVKAPKLSTELENLPFKKSGEKVYVKYYSEGVQAGFPSPAEDFIEDRLSLDKRYLKNPDATYLVRVKGNSMSPTLEVGDILIVKSDVELSDNDIGIISVNNTDFTAKRFDKVNQCLVADNKDFESIPIDKDDTLVCLGVVKHIIRDL
jgi:DNA polymerase V